ncbi:MAG: ferredoxin [Planctomycetota bacterium]|jgi:ferredoxin
MPHVSVDAEKCVGHGRCYVLAPEVFDEDERGHCVVISAQVPDALAEDARKGERNCPEHAIRVER